MVRLCCLFAYCPILAARQGNMGHDIPADPATACLLLNRKLAVPPEDLVLGRKVTRTAGAQEGFMAVGWWTLPSGGPGPRFGPARVICRGA